MKRLSHYKVFTKNNEFYICHPEPQVKDLISIKVFIQMKADASTACAEVRSISMTNVRGVILMDKSIVLEQN